MLETRILPKVPPADRLPQDSPRWWVPVEALDQPADPASFRLWSWLRDRLDFAQFRPQAIDGVVTSHLTGRDGDYSVLKNPSSKTYHRLSEKDFFLWELLDGTRSVQDLVLAYFLKHGSFAYSRVAAIVSGLWADRFLTDQPELVYSLVRRQVERSRPGHRLSKAWSLVMQRQFAISGIDGLVGAIYRRFARLLFTLPAQVLFLLISLVGLVLFALQFSAGTYGVVSVSGSYWVGIGSLVLVNVVVILTHEFSHALAVKHFGREVRRGGFMIYFGMPAFFVDTTDIWMEGKRARLAVTWAGPYSGLILGGLASIVLTLWPDLAVNPVLYQFALMSFLTVFLNLNPLLELDGYYILMDWLELPMLRRRSLQFLRTGFLSALSSARHRATSLRTVLVDLSREERIFTAYGLLSLLWTSYAIYCAGVFWQSRLFSATRSLWTDRGDIGKMALAAGMVLLSLPFVIALGLGLLGMLRQAVAWVIRRGMLRNTWALAALLLALSVGLAVGVPRVASATVTSALTILVLALCTFAAAMLGRSCRGSRLAPFFVSLSAAAVCLGLARVAVAFGGSWAASASVSQAARLSFAFIAYGCLISGGLLLMASTNLKELRPLILAVLAVGLLGSYALLFWLAELQQWTGAPDVETLLVAVGCIAPLLVLVCLVPSLLATWRTGSAPGWLCLVLSQCALLVITIMGWHPLLAFLLLLSGMTLLLQARRQLATLAQRRESEPGLSDGARLSRAFVWTAGALLEQFRHMTGDPAMRALTERFNRYSLAAGWQISLAADKVHVSPDSDRTLSEQSVVFAEALTSLLDLLAAQVGEQLSVRALQRAYDSLPWEEREVGGEYLFREVARSRTLSDEFRHTRQEYIGLLRRMPLFADLSESDIALIASRLHPDHVRAGEAIVRQGQSGDLFYIIRHGHVSVDQRDQRGTSVVVNLLQRGDYFGEVALLKDEPRNATCTATVPTEVLSLRRQDFDVLVRQRFDLSDMVERSVRRVSIMRQIPLFADLSSQEIGALAARLQEKHYAAGQTIIHQGQAGRSFFIIESGRVVVRKETDGETRVITERGPGEYVGEIALLLDVPRTATVVAKTDVHTLCLDKSDFQNVVAGNLRLSQGLERVSSRRIRDLLPAPAVA